MDGLGEWERGGRGATNISHTSHEVRWHASSLTVLVHSTDNMLAQSEQVSLVKEKRKKKSDVCKYTATFET